MKTFISLISCSIAASVVAFSICGCGKKDGGADGSRGSAHDWVKPSIPNPDAEGWITLFDGQRLYGCDPANPVFKSGKIFLQGGALWVDSTPIPFQLTAREAVVDIQVKKVSGQNVNITIGRDVGWFNGGSSFGIGRVVDGKYRDLKTGKSSFSFTDFVDMEFLAAGGNLALIAGGQTVTRARDQNRDERLQGRQRVQTDKNQIIRRAIAFSKRRKRGFFHPNDGCHQPASAGERPLRPRPDQQGRLREAGKGSHGYTLKPYPIQDCHPPNNSPVDHRINMKALNLTAASLILPALLAIAHAQSPLPEDLRKGLILDFNFDSPPTGGNLTDLS
jgi:hypothetical protein